MGENEQGGMLRTVIVVGLIALIAAVVTALVIGLKGDMAAKSDKAVGTIATVRIPHAINNGNVKYASYTPNPSNYSGYGDHAYYMPIIGDVPSGSWREFGIVMTPSKDVAIDFDVNTNKKDVKVVTDYDDLSKRDMKVYQNGKVISHSTGTGLMNRVNLKANTMYTVVVKYYNNSGFTFVDQHYKSEWANLCALHSTTSDGSPYDLNIDTIESATYENKYNQDN